jgi:small subunit ribosomal protein S6
MKKYELTYLISAEKTDQEAKEKQTSIISLIQKEEGILVEEKPFFKKKLAYPVKKQRQAYLATIFFQISPEKIEVLEKFLKQDKDFLRYLILIKMPAKKVKPSRSLKKPDLIKAKKEKKVDLDKIGQKLEEILNE